MTLQTKLLFKNICETKSDWDDDLVESLYSKWRNFVYRWNHWVLVYQDVFFYLEDFVYFIELHGFADSSNQAYAAVIYTRLITSN